MTMTPLRLQPGEDLRVALELALQQRGLANNGAFVVCGIGSLSRVCLRLAGAEALLTLDGLFELLTLSGTLTADGVHLHMSVADVRGQVLGGHVGSGCIVRTTAEILIAPLQAWTLGRAFDAGTGYQELTIAPINPGPSLD